MERLSFEEQLEDLRDISGTVDDYIVRGLYIDDAGIDAAHEPNFILKECYGIIIDELYEYGISFFEDESDLLQDWYTAKHIYYIRAFVDADNLLRILSIRQSLDELDSILDVDDYTGLFQQVVDFAFPRTTSEIYQILSSFAERVQVNDRFVTHLKACIKRIGETGSIYHIPENELGLVRNYIAKVQKARAVVNKAYEFLRAEITPIPFAQYLPISESVRFIRTYDLEKIDPSHVRQFAMLDRKDTLDPIGLRELEEQHHKNSIHHVEYYLDKGKHISATDAIFIFIALIAELPPPEEFNAKAAVTKEKVLALKHGSWSEDIIDPLINALNEFLAAELNKE